MVLLLFLILAVIVVTGITKMTLAAVGGAIGLLLVLFAFIIRRRRQK